MRFFIVVIAILLMDAGCIAQNGFKESQQRYPRVRQAYSEKWDLLAELWEVSQIRPENMELCLEAFKQEKKLQVWARNRGDAQFTLLKSYLICATSGRLGPKRMQGDSQIPEGFYHIRVFNPASSFHLSLGINYPNTSDRILGHKTHPGGEIFIHGSCVTIGCIPITDEMIKEVYLLCVEARNNGQENIPVTIYPAALEDGTYRTLTNAHAGNPDCLNLWDSLKTAYHIFHETHLLPRITFLADGSHQVR